MLTHLTSLPLHFGFQISEMVTEHRYDVSLVCTQTNIFEQRQKPFQENDQSLHQPQDTCHPKPIIQTMISSSTASRNGRVLRLSILSTDRMAILLLSLNASVRTKIQWFLNFYIQRLLGQLSELSLVQTPHLCLQDLLPTSACRDILNAHLQASCRSFHLSKHLTCVSRTHSQPQPVEILTIISKTCRFRQSIDKSPSTNDLTANMPQKVKQKHIT